MSAVVPLRETLSGEQYGSILRSHERIETFERIELAAGPRPLPSWVRDAHIDWAEGYGNRPRFKVRCRVDPLKFSDFGNPSWERTGVSGYIAEQEGVAAVHYHGGAVTLTDFEDFVRWTEQPSQANNWKGVQETRPYQMLATTQQQGYAGRHFDITMKDGRNIRLRGPWHGGAPDGFAEVSYTIDGSVMDRHGRPGSRWYRKWHQRGGYFGLYIRPEVLLDIMATYLPHVSWCWVITERKGETTRSLEPLRPETDLPKGWHVDPADCLGHRFGMAGSNVEHPAHQCVFCGQRRDPNWVSPYQRAAQGGAA